MVELFHGKLLEVLKAVAPLIKAVYALQVTMVHAPLAGGTLIECC